ncbi:MAG: glycosyltransferase, partial [Pirellulaceae bacterium]|nr:glycosyltransferase [Pirellulaceae bacterium]
MPAVQQPGSQLSQAAGQRRAARRLAYIVHSMQAGGLEKCVADLATHLDPERWQPLVICLTRSGPAADWIRRPHVPVVELHKRAGNDWGLVRRLVQTLRQWNVELAHSHNWGTLVETSLACRRSQVAHVHAEHGLELNGLRLRGARSRLRRWARQWAFRRADAVVAVADSVR